MFVVFENTSTQRNCLRKLYQGRPRLNTLCFQWHKAEVLPEAIQAVAAQMPVVLNARPAMMLIISAHKPRQVSKGEPALIRVGHLPGWAVTFRWQAYGVGVRRSGPQMVYCFSYSKILLQNNFLWISFCMVCRLEWIPTILFTILCCESFLKLQHSSLAVWNCTGLWMSPFQKHYTRR
jgi:hypothetical protein